MTESRAFRDTVFVLLGVAAVGGAVAVAVVKRAVHVVTHQFRGSLR